MEYPASVAAAAEGGYMVTVPDFRDFAPVASHGETEAEALEMATDAIRIAIRTRIRGGQEIPRPGKPRGRNYRMVRLSALDAAKVSLYTAFRESGMKKVDLARRLGIPKTTVDRLFDLENHSRLDQIEAAFAAVGKRISIEVHDGA